MRGTSLHHSKITLSFAIFSTKHSMCQQAWYPFLSVLILVIRALTFLLPGYKVNQDGGLLTQMYLLGLL